MSLSDPLADMLTRIRNGGQAKKIKVSSPSSKIRKMVLEVLKNEGYIKDYSESQVKKGINELTIELKYLNGSSVIKKIERISTPGRRVYSQIAALKKYYNGLGVVILSTPKGVMSDHDARLAKVGGEIICRVF